MPKPVKFEMDLVFADRNFPLAVCILDNHPDYPLHVHDFSEIVIISHGNPLFPFSDRLPSVYTALGEKAIS